MSKQKIAQKWKLVRTGYNAATGEFPVTTTSLGTYTAATIKEKIDAQHTEYNFLVKSYHGFGGYWVNKDGDVLEVLPA